MAQIINADEEFFFLRRRPFSVVVFVVGNNLVDDGLLCIQPTAFAFCTIVEIKM